MARKSRYLRVDKSDIPYTLRVEVDSDTGVIGDGAPLRLINEKFKI